ncbi:glycosyltransferase family 2 protein [Hyunsoonleella pacifica]|nr:glycosyltransferase family 2 protein [Hyunsoonleella pacifica]
MVKIAIFGAMGIIDVSVIISTYNKPEYLEKVLWSYQFQTFKNFEIIIADDGSTDETKAMVNYMVNKVDYPIRHVWHPDNGFQKTVILNKATLAAMADYLIYTDGDCIARCDFVETHLELRRPNIALSGGYFKLTEDVSKLITLNVIESQNCFKKHWLLKKGQPWSFKMNKLSPSKLKTSLLNTFTTTKATFDGMNVSVWKDNVLEVNGFDERMVYGGEDRELGERLVNLGIVFKQIRYSAICLHLHHQRPYKNEKAIANNKLIRMATKNQKSTYTKFGITKTTH